MAISAEQQKNNEVLQSPEYWWNILKNEGQFWVRGMRWDKQIQALALETGEDIPGDQGLPYDRFQGRYGGDGYNEYDVHYNGTRIPFPSYPHTSHLSHGYLCNNLFTYEDPASAADKVGFSYGFFSRGVGDRGTGVPSSFNFILPKKAAIDFISEFSKDQQLLEKLFTSRYKKLGFDRNDDGILVVVQNNEPIFDTSTAFLHFDRKKDERPHSVQFSEMVQNLEQEDRWLEEHVRVYPYNIVESQRPFNDDEQAQNCKKYLSRVHKGIVDRHRDLRDAIERAKQSEQPLVEKIVDSVSHFIGRKRNSPRK